MSLTGQVGVVTTNPGWYGKLVQWFTRSDAYHTVGMISETMCISAETPRAVIRPVTDFGNDVIFTNVPMSQHMRDKVVAFWEVREGRPYAYLDIVLLVIAQWLGKHTPLWIVDRVMDDRQYFCSELCVAGWDAGGVEEFSRLRAYLVTPKNFLELATKDKAITN
jgi:hypothetical protein